MPCTSRRWPRRSIDWALITFRGKPKALANLLLPPGTWRRWLKQLNLEVRSRGFFILLPTQSALIGERMNLCRRSERLSFGWADSQRRYLGEKSALHLPKAIGERVPMAMASELSRPKQFRWRLSTFLAKGPAYLYVYSRWKLLERWRRITDSLESHLPADAALLRVLALDDPGLSDVRQSLAEGRSDAACAALVAHFQTRTQPRFHFSAADRLAVTSAVADDQREATVREADAVCDNVFQFRHLGPVKFETDINWMLRPDGNVDWMWDLNRHAYFNTLGKAYWYTGDEKHARKFVELLLDWIDKNPTGADQPNWGSVLEIGARLNNWSGPITIF